MSEASGTSDQSQTSVARPSIVVMKFGGTSVEDAVAINRTISIVKGRRDSGLQPVVVVSAMAKVTDQLLASAALAANNYRDEAMVIAQSVRERHLEAAAKLVGRNIVSLAKVLHEKFDKLEEILRGISAVGELTPRTNDLVVSYGERLSSRIVAAAFEHRGISSAHIDARSCIITDNYFGKAVPQPAAIEAKLLEHVLPLVEVRAIPVMGGFIGSTEKGITTTLGRGGSDYTASLVGGGLHAGAIEIWTDVNGIMTTDPRICPDALRVKTISFDEAAELAYFGAKVLHPATILPAVQKNIPVWVLNSHNPENEGTKIAAIAPKSASLLKSIAMKKKLTIIQIVSPRMLMAHGYLKAAFEVFDKYKCPIDMVSTSEVSVSLTVDSNEQLPAICAELGKFVDVKMERNMALVCLVGEDIRGRNGIAARVFSVLRDINVQMISQGANGINMSFMIEERDVETAIRTLHAEFFADPDPAIFVRETEAVMAAA
jgi:aspartate kinase